MSDSLQIAKEVIRKEAEALFAFSESLGPTFEKAADLIFSCKGTVLLSGIGKSGIIARKWSSTLSSTGTKSYFINSSEASHGDLGIIHKDDVLILLSFSGESEELRPILRFAREIGIPIIGITGNATSTLSRESLIHIPIQIAEEACILGIAPTSSTTVMMALGDALAMALVQKRGFTEKDFAKLHPGGTLGKRLWLKVSALMHTGEHLPTVAPETPLKDVLMVMTQKFLGSAVVVKENKVEGIITDGDLRRFFQGNQNDLNILAKDIMTRNPKHIGPNALAFEAREVMETNAIQQLLVKDENDLLVGVLHIQDLLRAKVV